jgi:hypothetical protein
MQAKIKNDLTHICVENALDCVGDDEMDREKVIKGLECCFNPHSEHSCLCRCADCPYNPQEDDDWNQQCQIELNRDALALLKEQKAVEPTIDEYGNKRCGSCGHKLQSIADPDLFCCKCGKPVLWEGR